MGRPPAEEPQRDRADPLEASHRLQGAPAAPDAAVQVVDATDYLAPYPRRHVRRPVRLTLTEHAYPLEPSPKESWLPIAFRAFAELASRRRIRDMLILGTGNGLDALGALEILDPGSLAVTDLHEAGVAVARDNVLDHVDAAAASRLRFHAGDLFSCIPPGARFDLVYENLPNVPAPPGLELARGTNSGRFFDAGGLLVPEPFGRYLLALHLRCLTEARPRLHDGGGVLTAIGGRIPLDAALGLHRACGYRPELVAFDMKRQVEPGLVLPGYRRAEQKTGVEFRFYADEAVAVVAKRRREGLDGQRLADAVRDELERLAISATEAERRCRRGEPVAHSVLMVFGELDEGRPPAA
jgi:hypothetical protein